jgi:predicted metal-dependent HD superfamily phosphohydrolase
MNFEAAKVYAFKRLRTEISSNYYYHNIRHTFDVWLAVVMLAPFEKIVGDDLILVQTAAIFHDLGMIDRYDCHEEESVRIATKVLPGFDYKPDQIKKVNRMILATQFLMLPKDNMERVICDADLDYLGRPDYFAVSHRLKKEWEILGIAKYSPHKWNLFQEEFLQKHKYFTRAAQLSRNEGKEINIKKVKHLLLK